MQRGRRQREKAGDGVLHKSDSVISESERYVNRNLCAGQDAYFTILGSQLESAPIKKPSVLAAAAGACEGSEWRAG